jgi:DNA-binding Xre family transcriptional regulator
VLFNFDKLTGLIVEKFKTKKNFSKSINLSERSVYLKLQGKVEFKPSEIDKACELLDIKIEDIPIYFFDKKVQKN